MRDSAEYSTIVCNEILTCPVPETHVLVHAPKCEVPCVRTFPRPSLSFRTLNLTISIVGTPRRKKKTERKKNEALRKIHS